jgi:hypothetical protein
MGRSIGMSFEIVNDNLVKELNDVTFEFFNCVNKFRINYI